MTHPRKHPPPGDSSEARERASEPAPPDVGASPGVPGEVQPRPQDPLAAKTRECRDLVDQFQRLAAEYSNYQKRMQRVMEDEKRQAIGEVVLDLLPAIDNFERALAAAQAKPEFETLLEGVRLVQAQLLAGLKKHGITPIETGGKAFDPAHHEAVAHVHSDEHAAGQVIHEMHKGYLLDGRILRPSRVAVSKGKAAEGQAEAPAEDGPGDEADGGE